jgi:hypothetical protein
MSHSLPQLGWSCEPITIDDRLCVKYRGGCAPFSCSEISIYAIYQVSTLSLSFQNQELKIMMLCASAHLNRNPPAGPNPLILETEALQFLEASIDCPYTIAGWIHIVLLVPVYVSCITPALQCSGLFLDKANRCILTIVRRIICFAGLFCHIR